MPVFAQQPVPPGELIYNSPSFKVSKISHGVKEGSPTQGGVPCQLWIIWVSTEWVGGITAIYQAAYYRYILDSEVMASFGWSEFGDIHNWWWRVSAEGIHTLTAQVSKDEQNWEDGCKVSFLWPLSTSTPESTPTSAVATETATVTSTPTATATGTPVPSGSILYLPVVQGGIVTTPTSTPR